MLSKAEELMACYHSCVGAATAVVAPEGGTFKPVDHAQDARNEAESPVGVDATPADMQRGATPEGGNTCKPVDKALADAAPPEQQTSQRAKRSRTT